MIVRRDRGMLAVLIMLDVAFHAGRTSTVSAADLAERAGLARRGIEPLLQTLSRSGLLESIRGPRGGYRLGRPRRDIHLDDVVRTALSDDAATAEDGPGGALQDRVIEPLWAELDAEFAARLHGLTLEDLIRRAEAAGLDRPVAEPITFFNLRRFVNARRRSSRAFKQSLLGQSEARELSSCAVEFLE